MEAIMPLLIQALLPMLGSIITALVGWLLVEIQGYVKNKTKSQQVNDALAHVTKTAATIVKEVEQTVVPYYIKNSVDGKLTKEQMEAVKQIAYSKVKDQLPTVITDLAGTAVNSIEE